VTVARDDQVNSRSESQSPAYAPSWIDRFTAWVARLPGSSGSTYLGIGLVLFLVQTAVLWGEGAYPVGTFVPAHGFIAGMMPFFLALLHYLDEKAGAALTALRPALKASEKEYSELRYQLTTLPARPALLASLGGAAIIILINEKLGTPSSFEALVTFPISKALIYWMYVSAWWFFGAFVFHTVHKLRAIDRIYTRYTCVNLFRMRPLYALSGVTALTAGSLTATTYAWYALNPGMLQDPTSLRIALPISVWVLATFIWPQLGIHRLQAAEKERMLDEAHLRFEAAIVELHRRVDEGRLEGMDDLNKAIASLEIEQRTLDKIPTWPWEPEAVCLLITAVALPLGLWIIQFVLQRILAP